MTAPPALTGRTAAAIAAEVESAIVDGRLGAGDVLPAVRAVASELGLSPTTVASAYRALGRRGLVRGEGRRGTVVAGRSPLPASAAPVIPPGTRDLATGNPDPALLPDRRAALAALDPSPSLYGGPAVEPALAAVARAALVADAVPVEHLAVVGGACDGIERVLEAHLRPGDTVALEDPGYAAVADLVAALGLRVHPVAVDDRGARPDALAAALRAGAGAVVLTPRALNPTGAAFDGPRAGDLRVVLDEHRHVLVVEDDHAGEVAGVAAHTVVTDDRPRWAVIRSVSKPFGPDLRLAVLAGDGVTVARVAGRQQVGPGWVPTLVQRLVAALAVDPATAATLRRAAAAYADRRAALVAALAADGVEVTAPSGLNVWVPVPDEDAAVRALLADGWAVAAGARFRRRSSPAVRITVARLPVEEAPAVAAALAAALHPDRTRSRAG